MNSLFGGAVALSLVALGGCSGKPETPDRTAADSAAQAAAGTAAMPAPAAGSKADARTPTFSVPSAPVPPAGAGAPTPPMPPPAAGASGSTTPPLAAAGSSAAPPRRDEHLDPSVKFDWEQSTPGMGAAKTCRAGTYAGSSQYVCMPVDAGFGDLSGFGSELTATITIELVESANGEFLQIANGEFSSLSIDVFGLVAKLRGTLDCGTLQFKATTEDGSWGLGDPTVGVLPLGTFEAELTGTLDPATGTLSGSWTITGSVPFVCTGPWSAKLAQ